MPTYNLTMDIETGAVFAIDKNGARRSMSEIEDAEARAKRGDPDAIATLLAVDVGVDADGHEVTDYDKLMEAIMHDCPDCQAARARGEKPIVFSSADLEALIGGGPGPSREVRERARTRRRRRSRRR